MPPSQPATFASESKPAFWRRVKRLIRVSLHWLRWSGRFAGFGWKSTLSQPDLLTGLSRVRIGRGVEIRKGARIEVVGPGTTEAISIGDGTSIHLYFHVGAAERVTIGRNVLIAGHVYITDHDHDLGEPGVARFTKPALQVDPTRIEDDCWLGEGCKILKGVRLGRGCVVGANAVVTRSFEPYTVVAGIPARAIRHYDAESNSWIAVPNKEES